MMGGAVAAYLISLSLCKLLINCKTCWRSKNYNSKIIIGQHAAEVSSSRGTMLKFISNLWWDINFQINFSAKKSVHRPTDDDKLLNVTLSKLCSCLHLLEMPIVYSHFKQEAFCLVSLSRQKVRICIEQGDQKVRVKSSPMSIKSCLKRKFS